MLVSRNLFVNGGTLFSLTVLRWRSQHKNVRN